MPNSASHRTPPCSILPLRRTPAAKSRSNDDILLRFGSQLRQLRQDRGFNQTGFAKHIKVDRSYLSDVERGRKVTSLLMLDIFALGLGMDLSELLRDVSPPLERKSKK